MEKLQQVLHLMPDSVSNAGCNNYLTLVLSRCAMPYGGFEKANQFMKFQLPKPAPKLEPEPPMVYQHDAACRPSFNRTPTGWVGSSEPCSIHMETDGVPFDGETDEL